MIYKDFVAEAAQKIMAAVVAHKNSEGLRADKQEMKDYARGSVAAAKMLADALDEDWQDTPVDSIHRFSEKEEYFDKCEKMHQWTKDCREYLEKFIKEHGLRDRNK